jgi:predicted enzyme related to lactoylglutathione lyase
MSTTATPAAGISATAAANRGRFSWVELMTTDPAAAQTFYQKVVGWGATKMEGGPVEYTLFTAGERPVAGLMALPPEAAAMGAPPSWLAYVEVPDVDATVDQAAALGAKVVAPAMDIPQAGRFAVLQDPQGGVFAIIASANPLAPESDPAPLEFSWHELTTSDQPVAISFYEQLFGWTKQSEFDMGDMGIYYMFGRDRFTYGGIMEKPPQAPGTYWLHYARVADSADAAAERAVALGAKIMVPPMEVPGGDRVAVLSDPQGAVFAVHSK